MADQDETPINEEATGAYPGAARPGSGAGSPSWADHPPVGPGGWPPPGAEHWSASGPWSQPAPPYVHDYTGGGWTAYQAPPKRRRGARAAVAAAAVVAMVGVGVAVGYAAAPSTSSSPAAAGGGSSSLPSSSGGLPTGGSSTGGTSTGGGSISTASGGPSDAATIAKDVDPGLVDINTTLNYEDEDAAGTGMVLTSSGEILTNNHVIEDATSISVTDIGNGKTYGATVVGYDRTVDIAVLQLKDASGLKTVDLGNSSSVKTGEAIVGIGNAGGSGGTPSVAGGSVTGLDKSITASDEGSGTTEQLTGMIESNADIEPGDSGGPLVNSKGRVVGMDTAALSDGSFTIEGASSSEGFSIPINTAKKVAKKIEAGDSSSTVHVGATPFLGVEIETSSSSSSGASGGTALPGEGSGLPGGSYEIPGETSPSGGSGASTTSGAVIAGVASGTPAATANLAAGDVITGIGGKTVTSASGLTDDVMSYKPGSSVSITYVNTSDQTESVTVTLASGPPQ